jgi:hypothetical protein
MHLFEIHSRRYAFAAVLAEDRGDEAAHRTRREKLR